MRQLQLLPRGLGIETTGFDTILVISHSAEYLRAATDVLAAAEVLFEITKWETFLYLE